MNYEILITSQAEKDLREIFKYIAYDLQSPLSALHQLERIEKKIYSLHSMVERFRLY